jgi:hypothetical protein
MLRAARNLLEMGAKFLDRVEPTAAWFPETSFMRWIAMKRKELGLAPASSAASEPESCDKPAEEPQRAPASDLPPLREPHDSARDIPLVETALEHLRAQEGRKNMSRAVRFALTGSEDPRGKPDPRFDRIHRLVSSRWKREQAGER